MHQFNLKEASEADLHHVRELFREYASEIEVDLCFQGFEQELQDLPGKYAPPDGSLILAWDGGRPVGCVALRQFSPGVAEMKRLYVRPEARGTGLGRRLALRFLEDAALRGYQSAVLDTLKQMEPARVLYASLGFVVVEAYYRNPLPGVVYMRRDLHGDPLQVSNV